jgi:wyosine [tRNA(Phe)-imidazoG37] synthetase (radical SAM superfamily)
MNNTLDFAAHPRNWRNFRLVYPVIARRSRGLSIGVNLNPDRVCNYDCIYCEVNRRDFRPSKGYIPLPPKGLPRPQVNLEEVKNELKDLLSLVKSGAIWQESEFTTTPAHLQRLNDIAFSGDGEPTTYPHFSEAIKAAIEARVEAGFEPEEVKLVLITNATRFHRPNVQEGLSRLLANNGEIWAKLDAGTEEYFKLIDKTAIKYEHILENLLTAATHFPINIQTCMLRVRGEAPSELEIAAYCGRLNDILAKGGKLNTVQLYTVARPPAQEYATSLTDAELNTIAQTIRQTTGLEIETFGGNVGIGDGG